jgi:hypothetical protein
MKRDYANGIKDDIVFFTGIEVEKTLAYNMKTLFVVGVQDVDEITQLANKHTLGHIFCGANHSFNSMVEMLTLNENLSTIANRWDTMICDLLNKDYLVTLDFDVADTKVILEMICNEHNNFIPQVSVKIPYIKQLNYNAMIKIDDIDFKATNQGVWCHRLHDLLDPTKFTPWKDYGKDNPI